MAFGRKTRLAVSALVVGALMVGTMGLVTDGSVTTDQAVTGSNIIWGIFSGLTGLVYGIRAYRRRTWDETRILMIGIACVAWAGFLHRAYWTTFRYLRALDPAYWELGAKYSEILVPVVWLTCFGYAWHLSPIQKTIFGRHWMAASMLIMMGLFWLGVWLTPS